MLREWKHFPSSGVRAHATSILPSTCNSERGWRDSCSLKNVLSVVKRLGCEGVALAKVI